MAPLLGEVIIGFIPGSDAIALFQAIGNQDVVGASIAMGGLVVDLAGLRAVRGAIRATRVFRKGLIIARKLGRALSAAGKAARRGFKTVVENGKLVLRRGDRIIAQGDDAVKKFLEVVNIPKGSRPNPSTYLDPSYITKHLAKFKDGASRIVKKSDFDEFGIGKPDIGKTEFVGAKLSNLEVDEASFKTCKDSMSFILT